jgi:Na+-driven multidrug efflux pump
VTPLRSWWSSAARILPLAWPVFIGQLAVLAFATIDTLMVARHSAIDLAALAVGNAAYVSVFIGLTGVVQAVAPITGQLFGARRLPEAGQQLHQALWLALGLSFLGCSLLVFRAVPGTGPGTTGRCRKGPSALRRWHSPCRRPCSSRRFEGSTRRYRARRW